MKTLIKVILGLIGLSMLVRTIGEMAFIVGITVFLYTYFYFNNIKNPEK